MIGGTNVGFVIVPLLRGAQKGRALILMLLLGGAGIGLTILMVLLLRGGGKIDIDTTLEVPASGRVYIIEPARQERTLKVLASSQGGKISVLIYVEAGARGEQEIDVDALRNPRASRVTVQDAALEADVPADHTALVVLVPSRAQPTTVKLRITN